MGTGWERDKGQADHHLPEIKRMLADVFVCAAPEYQDMHEATDLMVMQVSPYRVGCRVRNYRYYEDPEWRYQFTFRMDRPSGNDTEYKKIIDGWGDYLFYAFSTCDGTALHSAILINLRVFRAALIATQWRRKIRNGIQENKDGSSRFRWFDYRSFPPELLERSWLPELKAAA